MTIDAILADQAGVISRAQAVAAGLSREAVDHRLRMRRWRPLHPRIYLAAGHRHSEEAAVRAALLWAGADAALCGTAAAWWWGMVALPPRTIGVTVGRRRPPHPPPGVSVHRRDLEAVDLAGCRGLPTTARPLTVLEAAVEAGAAGSALLDHCLQREVAFPAVYEAHRRHLRACGAASAGRMLAAAADRSAAVTLSLLVGMLRASGAAGWHVGLTAAGRPIDLAFPAARVAVEVCGWAWHLDAEHVQAAERRRAALTRQGWTILRCRWHDLVATPAVVLAGLAHEVARGMAEVHPAR